MAFQLRFTIDGNRGLRDDDGFDAGTVLCIAPFSDTPAITRAIPILRTSASGAGPFGTDEVIRAFLVIDTRPIDAVSIFVTDMPRQALTVVLATVDTNAHEHPASAPSLMATRKTGAAVIVSVAFVVFGETSAANPGRECVGVRRYAVLVICTVGGTPALRFGQNPVLREVAGPIGVRKSVI